MVVDAHHHLWDPAHREYPWMGDELDAIRRRFDASDLKPLLDANGIDRTVVVQTVSSLEETREFLQTAAENELVQRVPRAIQQFGGRGWGRSGDIGGGLPGSRRALRHCWRCTRTRPQPHRRTA